MLTGTLLQDAQDQALSSTDESFHGLTEEDIPAVVDTKSEKDRSMSPVFKTEVHVKISRDRILDHLTAITGYVDILKTYTLENFDEQWLSALESHSFNISKHLQSFMQFHEKKPSAASFKTSQQVPQ